MLRSTITVPLAAVALFTTAPTAAQSGRTPPPSVEAATREAQPYLFHAGASDVFEITSSQLAIMRSRDPEVRRYATALIDHHTRTTNRALAAAKQSGVTPPPPVLTPQQRGFIDRIANLSGPDFDRAYAEVQVPAHQAALAVHSGYASNGDTDALRTVARGAVPIVQGHLEGAQRLQARLR